MPADDRLAVLGEEYSAEILAATADPKSARELSEQLEVPIATCYRRIEALVEVGLLVEEGRELSDRGRRTSVYSRSVDGLSVTFEDGEVAVATTDRPEDEDASPQGRSDGS